MSLVLFYAGHFLFDGKREAVPVPPDAANDEVSQANQPEPKVNPVKHIRRTETINGLKQEINMLEIDPASPRVNISPVLSHDLIYGFELLSVMAERKNAYAAVNGGFFREFGLPSGMVVINGELYSASTGKYPVFVIENGKAGLREIDGKLSVEIQKSKGAGQLVETGNASIDRGINALPVDNINIPAGKKQTVVYTPAYGKSNRAKARNITAVVEDGVVTKIADYPAEADIPENGMLISFFDVNRYAGIELPVTAGDEVRLVHQPQLSENMQAYECGSWLVKDGVPVVKEKDEWVGIMTNRDPRTAVGIKDDGKVLLLTVDGRQPGYSVGFTGMELAEYLIGCGAKDAAMLDGGASTEMLLEGRLVSRPSYKGQEREVAGGILVLLQK